MGLGYRVGDVVWAHFRFQERRETKVRPVVILEVLENESYVCMITSKDKRATCTGVWVLKDSPEGQEMGLLKDSFVNASRKVVIKNYMIEEDGWLGTCPFVEDLL